MLRVSSDRQVGWGALQRGLCARFLCAQRCRVPAQVSSISWEGPAHENPGGCGVPAQVSSISWEGPDHQSPGGCWVPAQVSSIPWEGPDHESPMGCRVPAQVSSISWEGSAHESPGGWEEHVNERPLYAASTKLLSDFPVGGAGVR